MKTIIREYIVNNLAFWVCALVSIGLIIGGFFVPPLGAIDGSVLKAVGELFGFATLWIVYVSVKEGVEAHIKKGDLDISIDTNNDE